VEFRYFIRILITQDPNEVSKLLQIVNCTICNSSIYVWVILPICSQVTNKVLEDNVGLLYNIRQPCARMLLGKVCDLIASELISELQLYSILPGTIHNDPRRFP